MNKIIDLRSDTLTQPTEAMRLAMAQAEVGDDVLEEDPTVQRLQKRTAEILGKESALFVPSGTMGNLICVLNHCNRGDEVILGDRSHIFLNEAGGISALGGMHPHILPNHPDGTMELEQIRTAIRTPDIHHPPTRLICLENTHNFCNGSPLSPDYMESVAEIAHDNELKIHLDGARLFNAAVALEIEAKELTRHVDSVMISLSKGLSAPVGSMIAGEEPFIRRAIGIRKMLGGGLRQSGHLAAAGFLALETMTDRLKEDHDLARHLAEKLSELEAIEINPEVVKTNILFFRLDSPQVTPEVFLSGLKTQNILIFMTDPRVFRAVVSRGITFEDIEQVYEVIQNLVD